jgi:hypothetical protein
LFSVLSTFLIGVLVTGPLGNLVYDRWYKQPVPELIVFLVTIWPWVFLVLCLVGCLILWSWATERREEAKRLPAEMIVRAQGKRNIAIGGNASGASLITGDQDRKD